MPPHPARAEERRTGRPAIVDIFQPFPRPIGTPSAPALRMNAAVANLSAETQAVGWSGPGQAGAADALYGRAGGTEPGQTQGIGAAETASGPPSFRSSLQSVVSGWPEARAAGDGAGMDRNGMNRGRMDLNGTDLNRTDLDRTNLDGAGPDAAAASEPASASTGKNSACAAHPDPGPGTDSGKAEIDAGRAPADAPGAAEPTAAALRLHAVPAAKIPLPPAASRTDSAPDPLRSAQPRRAAAAEAAHRAAKKPQTKAVTGSVPTPGAAVVTAPPPPANGVGVQGTRARQSLAVSASAADSGRPTAGAMPLSGSATDASDGAAQLGGASRADGGYAAAAMAEPAERWERAAGKEQASVRPSDPVPPQTGLAPAEAVGEAVERPALPAAAGRPAQGGAKSAEALMRPAPERTALSREDAKPAAARPATMVSPPPSASQPASPAALSGMQAANAGHPGIAVAEARVRDAAADPAPNAQETFAALDNGTARAAPQWLHASAQHAEAGFRDPSLGWVSVRADLNAGGIHASLVPGSLEAAQALSGHLAGLGAHLAEQHTHLASLSLATPAHAGLAQGYGEAMQQNREGSSEGSAQPRPQAGTGGATPPSGRARAAAAAGSGIPVGPRSSTDQRGTRISVMA